MMKAHRNFGAFFFFNHYSQTYHKFFLAKAREPLSHHYHLLAASQINPQLPVTAQDWALPKSRTWANSLTSHTYRRGLPGQKLFNGYGFCQP